MSVGLHCVSRGAQGADAGVLGGTAGAAGACRAWFCSLPTRCRPRHDAPTCRPRKGSVKLVFEAPDGEEVHFERAIKPSGAGADSFTSEVGCWLVGSLQGYRERSRVLLGGGEGVVTAHPRRFSASRRSPPLKRPASPSAPPAVQDQRPCGGLGAVQLPAGAVQHPRQGPQLPGVPGARCAALRCPGRSGWVLRCSRVQ